MHSDVYRELGAATQQLRNITMSTHLSLTLVALTLSIGATAITTTLPAQAGDGYVSIEQRGWANGAAGSQRGHRNRLTVYQDGDRNSAHSRQYGSTIARSLARAATRTPLPPIRTGAAISPALLSSAQDTLSSPPRMATATPSA